MTRLTNAFSKEWLNLRFVYALHFAYYKFCRAHKTVQVKQTMEARLTDNVWSLREQVI